MDCLASWLKSQILFKSFYYGWDNRDIIQFRHLSFTINVSLVEAVIDVRLLVSLFFPLSPPHPHLTCSCHQLHVSIINETSRVVPLLGVLIRLCVTAASPTAVQLAPNAPTSLTSPHPLTDSQPDAANTELPSEPKHVMAFLVSKRFVTLSWRQPDVTGTSDIHTYTVYWTEEGSDR